MRTLLTIYVLTLLMIFPALSGTAQVSGVVSLPQLGIKFTIPDGWVGQETQAGYVLGSRTEPGFVLLTTHEYTTLAQLEAEAKKGIQDQNGTQLQLMNSLEKIDNQGVGGTFEGTLEGQAAKAYIIGLLNPHGSGVTIITATTTEKYSNRYVQLSRELADSFVFSRPETLPIVEEWKQALQNTRLTYLDSYYSSGSSYGGYSTGGGYSTEIEITLCGKGYFYYQGSDQMSVDTGGAFGSSNGNDQGQGTWEVVGNSTNGALLRLNFANGQVYEYELSYQDQKTYLNGKRYFRTNANEKAYVCD